MTSFLTLNPYYKSSWKFWGESVVKHYFNKKKVGFQLWHSEEHIASVDLLLENQHVNFRRGSPLECVQI